MIVACPFLIRSANFINIFLGQLGLGMLLSPKKWWYVAPFFHCVLHIIGLRSNP